MSPSHASNPLLSEAPQTSAVQDAIIPRALSAFIDNAQAANAQGNQVECAVWLQAATMLQSDRPQSGLDLVDSRLKQNRIRNGIELSAQLVERHPQHALTQSIRLRPHCATTWRSRSKFAFEIRARNLGLRRESADHAERGRR